MTIRLLAGILGAGFVAVAGARAYQETPAAPLQSPPRFEQLTVPADSVIGIQLETAISTATARVEDRVIAHVTRDVSVSGRVAIPLNSRLEGVVSFVQRAGKFETPPELTVKFQALVLSDGTRVPIRASFSRKGESPAGSATSKVGAAGVMGGILGAVLGGKKGAVIGGAAGAAAGAAAVATSNTNELELPKNLVLTVKLTAPVTITVG